MGWIGLFRLAYTLGLALAVGGYNCGLPEPDFALDFESDDNSMVPAMINGLPVTGSLNGDVDVVPGVDGMAIQFYDGDNNGYISYGNQSSHCFSSPSLCSNGLTIGFWVQFKELETMYETIELYSSWGLTYDSIRINYVGFSSGSKRLYTQFKNSISSYSFSFDGTIFKVDVWYHFTFIYNSNTGIKAYIDGTEITGSFSEAEIEPISHTSDLTIGGNSLFDPDRKVRFIFDHMRAWHDIVDPFDVFLEIYHSDTCCGWVESDPNAVETAAGPAATSVITYRCLPGFEDSDGDDTYIRTCTSGSWVRSGGTACSDVDECKLEMPCDPNGNCMNVPGSYTCHCNFGYEWDGSNCTMSTFQPCAVIQNLNLCVNGDCIIQDNGKPRCRCHDGYHGDTCNEQPEQPCNVLKRLNLCVNGTCDLQDDGKPICRCHDGYHGDTCNEQPEQPCNVLKRLNLCVNGTCDLQDDGKPICRCHDGYHGDTCNEQPEQPCNVLKRLNLCVNGTCDLQDDGKPICRCHDNYEGATCNAEIRRTGLVIGSIALFLTGLLCCGLMTTVIVWILQRTTPALTKSPPPMFPPPSRRIPLRRSFGPGRRPFQY